MEPKINTFIISEFFLDDSQVQLKDKASHFIRKSNSEDYKQLRAILGLIAPNTSRTYHLNNGSEVSDTLIINNPTRVYKPFE